MAWRILVDRPTRCAFCFDELYGRIQCDSGVSVDVPPGPAMVLGILLRAHGKPVSAGQILEWQGMAVDQKSKHALGEQISKLRDSISDAASLLVANALIPHGNKDGYQLAAKVSNDTVTALEEIASKVESIASGAPNDLRAALGELVTSVRAIAARLLDATPEVPAPPPKPEGMPVAKALAVAGGATVVAICIWIGSRFASAPPEIHAESPTVSSLPLPAASNPSVPEPSRHDEPEATPGVPLETELVPKNTGRTFVFPKDSGAVRASAQGYEVELMPGPEGHPFAGACWEFSKEIALPADRDLIIDAHSAESKPVSFELKLERTRIEDGTAVFSEALPANGGGVIQIATSRIDASVRGAVRRFCIAKNWESDPDARRKYSLVLRSVVLK